MIVRTPCAAALTFALACGAAAHDPFERAEDGHVHASVTHEPAPGGVAGSATAPYGTRPDWSNDLRRQVGGLAVHDMNGDGLLDVVVGCYISNSFPPYEDWHNLIYFNVGGALEASPSWISDDEVSTGDIQVGLINDDPWPDVFAANGGFSLSPSVIYFGTPTGPSTTPGWHSADNAWNNYAVLFDVDHDGDIDVVTANQGNSPQDPYRPIYMFRNAGGTLPTTPTWQSAETSIQNFLAFADFDGDGWEDLAVSKWSGFQSAVYRNVGGTLQTTPAWTTGATTSDKGVAWGDLDGDGWPDLALGRNPTQGFDNDGGSLSAAWSAVGSYFGHSDLRLADVDGDGDLDLAEIHFANGHVRIYLNEDGALQRTPAWIYDAPGAGTAIAFGDISGDGRIDLVVGTSGEPSVRVFYALPPACPADRDGDGDVDDDDIVAVIQDWGCTGTGCSGDADGSGAVDVDDLVAVILGWGPC